MAAQPPSRLALGASSHGDGGGWARQASKCPHIRQGGRSCTFFSSVIPVCSPLQRTDSTLTSYAQDSESGTVTLADGEKLHADVIIGADGIHSVARTAVLGQQLVANRSGHSAYRSLVRSYLQLFPLPFQK